ncbi:hypothetical protein AB0E59_03205 [Lentzea sp. NPDC034063]|uniref:hypothetical protein n=1 Tax=unclassified Lentzea TaxID=2643253 RepID=UPI0033F9BCB5
MKLLLDRISLGFIAVTSAYVGGFAYFAPKTWYDTFPGLGLRWLPQLGPYNEHFAKDVGAAYLAFTALSLMALAYAKKPGVVPLAGAALLVFNTLHFLYHLTMLHLYEPLDQALNVVLLSLLVVTSVIPVIPGRAAVTNRSATSSP